jgi:hypothetical protein
VPSEFASLSVVVPRMGLSCRPVLYLHVLGKNAVLNPSSYVPAPVKKNVKKRK